MINPQYWRNTKRISTVPRSCSVCSVGIPERKGAWQLAKDLFYALKNRTGYDKNLLC